MKKLIIALTLLLAMAIAAAPAFAGSDDGKLNLNAATVEQLEAIDGISHQLAVEIVELRKKNGEFVDMSELLEVEGMDNTLLRKLDKFLYIEPASDCNC